MILAAFLHFPQQGLLLKSQVLFMGRGLMSFSESPLPLLETQQCSVTWESQDRDFPCVAGGAMNKEQESMSQDLWLKTGPCGIIANKGGD